MNPFRYYIKVLFIALCLLNCMPDVSGAILLTDVVSDCDTLFLSNGNVCAVKNITYTKQEIFFSYCDDAHNTIISAPWAQLNYVKRNDGKIFYPPGKEPIEIAIEKPIAGPVLTESEIKLEKQVRALNSMADLIFPAMLLFGAGMFIAIITLVQSKKLRKAVENHPNKLLLLKRIRRARNIAKITLLVMFTLGLALFVYLIYFFSLFNKL